MVVLAFSGGLDTSFLVPWLRETRGHEVITVTVDTGGHDAKSREEIEKRARALGACDHVWVDARQVYFEETLRFLIMGNVLRGHVYPLCVGAERALQARQVARVALERGARMVAHGSTAAGNDQVRFEVALRTLAPELTLLAPIRDEGFLRDQEVAWLEERDFKLSFERAVYSVNRGLWGCTIGGKETNDTLETIPEDAWILTRNAFDRPLASEVHRVAFERGVPVSLDGTPQPAVDLVEKLNQLAGRFGVGRGIHLGDTIFGLKGRVAFEAPAATVLITAHRELEKLTLTARQARVKDQVSATYGDLIHEAQALEPVCRDIEAFLLSSQARVSGEVTFRLRPGSLFVEGVSSPHSLRDASRAVYGEAAGEWSAADARGFSRLVALPSMLHARASGEALHKKE
jgi:argininosuccinate synthase